LSRNDLKPENPKGDQAAKYVLSCVVIAFGKGCHEIMDVQSQLLLLGVLPAIKIRVAERKKVDRLALSQTSTPEGVPLPSYRYGKGTSCYHTRVFLRRNNSDAGDNIQPVKADWQYGQQAKNSALVFCSQAYKRTFVLN
jgi:hypothetical protein